MACNVTLTAVSLPCGDLATGGLKSVYIINKTDLATAVLTVDAAAGTYATTTPLTAGTAKVLEFNNKDAFTAFTDVKTVQPDGTSQTVPTLVIEFTRMDVAHRTALNDMAIAGAELVAFVETAAGTQHMVGYEFGLYASMVDGASGTGRSEKNRYQLTLVGDENNLSYHPATSTDWDNIVIQ